VRIRLIFSKISLIIENPKIFKTKIHKLLHKDAFDINPKEIFFHEIKLKTTYEIIVMIKNLTKKPRKVRVF